MERFEQSVEPTRVITPARVDRIGRCHCGTCQAMLDADRRDAAIMLFFETSGELGRAPRGPSGTNE